MKRLAQAELLDPLGIDNSFMAVIRADDPRASESFDAERGGGGERRMGAGRDVGISAIVRRHAGTYAV